MEADIAFIVTLVSMVAAFTGGIAGAIISYRRPGLSAIILAVILAAITYLNIVGVI